MYIYVYIHDFPFLPSCSLNENDGRRGKSCVYVGISHTCVYVYIYIYVHIYRHTYVYICRHITMVEEGNHVYIHIWKMPYTYNFLLYTYICKTPCLYIFASCLYIFVYLSLCGFLTNL